MTADEIFAAIWQVNVNRCERPGPEKNIRQIAESVTGYEPKDAPIYLVGQENGAGPVEHEDSWTPVNLNLLPEHPPVQPTLGSVGLVYPGKRHVFSGPQESAKTLAAYAIGLQVVREDGHLILIDFEMGAWDARSRLRELGAEASDLDRIHYLEPSDPADLNTMNRLLILDPALVIVDAAAGAFDLQGLDDNKRQDVEKFTRLYVRTFWKAGIATIVLDHVVKNTETRGKYAVGSERKVGGADVHLGFDVLIPIARGKPGLYKITTHKDRGGFLKRGTLAHMRLDSHPETHQITWEFEQPETDDEFKPTTLMKRISEYLEKHPDGATRNQVETAIKGKRDYLRAAMDALVSEGYADETQGPRNARILTFICSYPQTTPPNTDFAPTSPDLAPGRSQIHFASSPPLHRGRGEVDGEEANTNSETRGEDQMAWLEQLAPEYDGEEP